MTEKELINRHNQLYDKIMEANRTGKSAKKYSKMYRENWYTRASDTGRNIDDILMSGRKFTI